jgi:hypothetical protein
VAIPPWIETGFPVEYLHAGEPFHEVTTSFGPDIDIRVHEYLSLLGAWTQVYRNGVGVTYWFGQIYAHFQI